MILHLCHDEKVISRTINYFEEVFPNGNKFIILLQKIGKDPEYVKIDKPNVFFEKYNSNSFWNIIGDISQYDHIIFHCLWPEFYRFTLSIPKGCPITWIVWGTDLYNDLLIKRGYQLYANPKEVKLFQEGSRSIFNFFYDVLKGWVKQVIRIKALKRIQNICASEGDFQLLCRFYPEVRPFSLKKFFYYPVDEIISGSLKELCCVGDNIIVGNSASYTNNHRYVFEILEQVDLAGRKVIVPLSYGKGRELALEAGKILKDHFVPILDFMQIDEYNKLLSGARTFIYGSFRQEAIGNILVALYLGGAVFLDERNPLLYDLRKIGYSVFSISQLPPMIHYNLSDMEKRKNRDLVIKLNSRELMLSYIKESFGKNE